MPKYETFDVPVEGGRLRVGAWGSEGPLILASHGITAHHVSFEALAHELGDGIRLVVPDHRGRGRSCDIEGPWGMRAHAADLVAILNHLGEEKADVLAGHSMGGFVAAVTGAEAPDRIEQVLMVDGGLPLVEHIPEGMTTEELVHAIIGPALERLDKTFESVEAYWDHWRAHPALVGHWSPLVERYLTYDLIGDPPELRPRAKKAAVLVDAESQLVDDLVPRSLERLRQPVRFLRAPRGVMNADPLYSEERLDEASSRMTDFWAVTVPDTNHYTILLSREGARRVAEEVLRLLS